LLIFCFENQRQKRKKHTKLSWFTNDENNLNGEKTSLFFFSLMHIVSFFVISLLFLLSNRTLFLWPYDYLKLQKKIQIKSYKQVRLFSFFCYWTKQEKKKQIEIERKVSLNKKKRKRKKTHCYVCMGFFCE